MIWLSACITARIQGRYVAEIAKKMFGIKKGQTPILPYRVDVLDWHRINASFRALIEEEHVVLE